MIKYSEQNKRAWEFNAYDFWCRQCPPKERARADIQNPMGQLKRYANYFDEYDGVRVANICGSCGKKAIPLALLGAKVTIFDISEDNKRYALEVAELAKAKIDFLVCDILDIDLNVYENSFDVVFLEGGVLHYFHNIDEFMNIMYSLLKSNGKMICSDFHPFTKIIDTLGLEQKT